MIIVTRKLQVRWPPVAVSASSSLRSSSSSIDTPPTVADETSKPPLRRLSFRRLSMKSKINLFDDVAMTAKLLQESLRFNEKEDYGASSSSSSDTATTKSTFYSTNDGSVREQPQQQQPLDDSIGRYSPSRSDDSWLREHSRISYRIRYNPFILKDTAIRNKRCKNDTDLAVNGAADDKKEAMDEDEERAGDGTQGYGRPDVWITPMNDNDDDVSRPRRKWIVKRVWDIEEKDAEEPQYEIENSDLAKGVQDLLGVPESERHRDIPDDGGNGITSRENPLFTVQKVVDVDGVMTQDSETPDKTLQLEGGADFAAQLERATTADDGTSNQNKCHSVSSSSDGAMQDDDSEPSKTSKAGASESKSSPEGGADFAARLERERAAEASARGDYEVICCDASFVSDLKEPSSRSLAGGASKNFHDASFSGPTSSAEKQRAILEEEEDDEEEKSEYEKPVGIPKKPVKLEKEETKFWWENPDSYKVPPSPSVSVYSKQGRKQEKKETKFWWENPESYKVPPSPPVSIYSKQGRKHEEKEEKLEQESGIETNEDESQLGTIYSGEKNSSDKKTKKKEKKEKKKKKKVDEEGSTRKSIRKLRNTDANDKKKGKKEKKGKDGRKGKKSKKEKGNKKSGEETNEHDREHDRVLGELKANNEKKKSKRKKKADHNVGDSSVSSTVLEEEELWSSSWANDYWGMSPRGPKIGGVIKKKQEYPLNF